MALLDLKVDNRGVCPEFEFLVEDHEPAAIDDGGPVVSATRVSLASPKRFELRWDNGSDGQAYLVRDLFKRAGKVVPMNYIPPDENAIVEVLFTDDLAIRKTGPDRWAMRFQVEEVV